MSRALQESAIRMAFYKAGKGGNNFVTPDITSYGVIDKGNIVYELSETGTVGLIWYLYGITVLVYKDGKYEAADELSTVFHSREERNKHIENLKEAA